MRRIAGFVAACAVLMGAAPVQAETSLQEAYQRMWINYCAQNWRTALQVNSELLAMPLSDESRQNIQEFRDWLRQAQRVNMHYEGLLPGCNIDAGDYDQAAASAGFFGGDRWSGYVLNRGPHGFPPENTESADGSSGGTDSAPPPQ